MQLQVSPSVLWRDGSSDARSDANNRDNTRKWANKLISLINRVIEKGLANPINFRRSINKVIEELLEDVKSDDWCWWALDYFLFRVYESIWAGDQSLLPCALQVPSNTALSLEKLHFVLRY